MTRSEPLKVGDKVKVITDILDNSPEYVGQVGVLESISDDGEFDYAVTHKDGNLLNWDRTELELVEPDDICNPRETGCGGMCSGCE